MYKVDAEGEFKLPLIVALWVEGGMFDYSVWLSWLQTSPAGGDVGYWVSAALAVAIIASSVSIALSIKRSRALISLRLSLNTLGQAHDATQSEVRRLEELYADPISREREVQRLKEEANAEHDRAEDMAARLKTLQKDYSDKKAIYNAVKAEAAIYDETIELAQIGFYQPHFRFDDSERYKTAIRYAKDEQKALVKQKRAIIIPSNWTVNGSRQEGKKLENRTVRLTLRAFNNECDAAVANVTWRNAEAMAKRINRAFEQINKENEPLGASISKVYLELKLDELSLTIEREEKRKREREETAELRRQEREEKKLQEEARRAEKEEKEAEERLTKARAQAEKAVGEELDALNLQIEELRQQLEQAHSLTERAKSMAEQTRLGHVYVISNQGSFGGGVFKIGLTRRLDPHDRIKELGDASVPFSFDTHALIFSEDAPALESALHNRFEDKRVNAANMRKEFFRVTLDEVEQAVSEVAPAADFYRDAEAQEYHETLMLQQRAEEIAEAEFPESI
ncbi:DUF4041 domain-containing protein [Marivibrio halodurans]|uniref:DUF4041 domain-containing protein n=1 Tax=Marivibrio halodurans TaxID=2039722 RepID=A0A8J7S0W8_9PROT|nr:DUF4041 domain-containing protein [Marivibrio halodurans]MBP5857860.1 DUF4041 domain-containing protein [Marivibrio halodurans]